MIHKDTERQNNVVAKILSTWCAPDSVLTGCLLQGLPQMDNQGENPLSVPGGGLVEVGDSGMSTYSSPQKRLSLERSC